VFKPLNAVLSITDAGGCVLELLIHSVEAVDVQFVVRVLLQIEDDHAHRIRDR
jgi:hypothetical protein